MHLKVGVLRDFQEEWMQRYFDHLSLGTIAEGAKLKVERVPLQLNCGDCGHMFLPDISQDRFQCPECDGKENGLVTGNEFLIESVGVV